MGIVRKGVLFISFVLLSFSMVTAKAQSQLHGINEKQVVVNVSRQIIAYNGAIVGYAKACLFPKHEYQLIEDGLFRFIEINNRYLSQTDTLNLKNYYEETRDSTYQKKNVTSKVECDLFREEFKKIYDATKEAMSKNPQRTN